MPNDVTMDKDMESWWLIVDTTDVQPDGSIRPAPIAQEAAEALSGLPPSPRFSDLGGKAVNDNPYTLPGMNMDLHDPAVQKRLLWSGLQVAGLIVIVGVVAFCMNWPSIKTFLIEDDLRDYARAIRDLNCSREQKEGLLDRVDAIENHLRRGGNVGWSRWQRVDEVVRDVLRWTASSDEVWLIQRELQRAEREVVCEELP